MILSRLFSRLLPVAGLVLIGVSAARGQGLTPVFLSANPSGSNFDYSYRLELLDNTTIDGTSNITFYDFNGMIGSPSFTSSFAGASFAGSAPLTGVPTATSFQTDDPTIANANLQFNGPSAITNNTGTSINLGTIDIISSVPLETSGLFTGYGVVSFNAGNGSPASNNSFVKGPNPQVNGQGIPDTPEPGTWALLVSSGVMGMAVVRRRGSRGRK